GEAGVSYYTRDISEQLLDLEVPFEVLSRTKPRTTSQIALAGEARLRYRFNTGNVNLVYRRIDPDYSSMGAFYMQTDVEQYTAGIALAILKQKLHLRGRFGWQRNNLARNSVHDSHRTIGN